MKTNHQRNFVEKKRSYSRYTIFSDGQICLDGHIVSASANCGDACCGKHGIARSRKGAKKYINSRRRRHDRDFLRKAEIEEGVLK
jgi:hypothetical protein